MVTLDYPPYEYSEEGKVQGVAVDVVREIFRRMEVEIRIEAYPWARSLKMVQLGEADGIFTAYKTQERESFMDYMSQILMPQEVSLFALKSSGLREVTDLAKFADHRIAARHGVSYGQTFDQAVENGVLKLVHRVSDGDTIVRLLINRRADLAVFNRLGGYYRFRQLGVASEIVELKPSLQSVPSYLAFSKARKLADIRKRADQILSEMKQDGSYDRLSRYTLQP